MKIKISLLLCCFFYSNIFTQNIDSLYQILENSSEIDSSFTSTLQIYLNKKSYNFSEKDIEWINQSKKIANENENEFLTAEMYFYLGWHNYQKSQIEKSIYNYLEAIKLIEDKNRLTPLLKYYTNLANAFNASNDFQKALDLNLKTISLIENDSSTLTKARYYFYTAKTYDRLKDYDNAEKYYLEAKQISKEANFPFGVLLSNSSLGHNYNEQAKFDLALPLLKKSLKAFESSGQKLNIAAANSSIANTYRGLNLFEKAANHYEKAIDIYLEIKNTSYLKYNYKWLAYCYRKLGAFDKSFINSDLALQYADTLYNQERLKAIEELKTQYETEKYQQEKIIAETESLVSLEKAKKSKIVSYGALIFATIVSLLIYFIFNRLKVIRKQKAALDSAYAQLEESKKNELAVSNLKALQSQMNPHFIFNALNSVQDLVLLKDIRNSNKYLGRFSDLIRKILLSSKEQFISLEEEIEILSLYLDLEKLRFGEDFIVDIQCNVSEEKQNEIELPAMFIQPYIENAIKHGLFHKEGQKILKVHFNLKGNKLECMIEDNGIGQKKAEEFKIKRLHLHTGFSTEAINERIRLLNETLDEKITLQVKDLLHSNNEPAGTKIILQFPIN